MQDLLQDLKQKASAYVADEGNSDALYNYANAAQALYDAIATVVNAGKTVVLEGNEYFSERQEIRTMGMGYNTDWLKFSSTRNDVYTFQSCCMTSARTIKRID